MARYLPSMFVCSTTNIASLWYTSPGYIVACSVHYSPGLLEIHCKSAAMDLFHNSSLCVQRLGKLSPFPPCTRSHRVSARNHDSTTKYRIFLYRCLLHCEAHLDLSRGWMDRNVSRKSTIFRLEAPLANGMSSTVKKAWVALLISCRVSLRSFGLGLFFSAYT